jgi:hypothetical protein
MDVMGKQLDLLCPFLCCIDIFFEWHGALPLLSLCHIQAIWP